MTGALKGLRVVDLSNTLTGTQISQTLADFGAAVIHVEPPGASPLRSQPAWPFWGRGKQSIVLDLKDVADGEVAVSLTRVADVVIETWRPGVAERLGLGYDLLSEQNPRLVYCSVTGFGPNNPLSQIKAYEPIVMSCIGGLDSFSSLSDRPGPSFVSTPYCTWSAGQLALQGVLAALYEREVSGKGQKVESTLVQGILAHDTWNWVLRMVAQRFSSAFSAAPPADFDRLVPNSPLFFRLLVGLSADGRWMQFSQTTERLWQAFLRATGLEWTLTDPVLKDGPTSDDPTVRVAFWEEALAAVRSKTYDEWMEVFDEEPDVWAELYRVGSELLHHPQMVYDHRTVIIDDPVVGPVHQPGPLVHMEETPAVLERSAPAPDQDGVALRAEAARLGIEPLGPVAAAPGPSAPLLTGVTVVELGTFYAAPFGATILTDYGARVIKIEQLDGDPMRSIMPFPEVGGIKVLQGKESVALDMTCPQGREIVLELVRHADAVLQTFRAGVAERHGYTAAELLAINPDLIYLSAPGYGMGGPCGHRPAFAPTMGAGAGLGYRNVGGPDNLPQGPELSMEEVKRYSMRLSTATMSVGHADGFSALGVGTALLMGLLARRRGAPGQALSTSMLSTMAHALSEDMVEYEGRGPMATPDHDLLGLGPRYRLYRTAQGWVFLAAPSDRDWEALAQVLGLAGALKNDEEALTARLEEILAERTASEWQAELTAADIACVEVASGPVEEVTMLGGGLGRQLGIVTDVDHPVIETYPRLTPLAHLSRSAGVVGRAPLCGQHTEAVLAELGFEVDQIVELRSAGVIA